MMNTKILSVILFIILLVVAYNYFNSMPVEADNTSMNDDDSITYSINQYDPIADASYSFMNKYDRLVDASYSFINNYDMSLNMMDMRQL